MWMGKDGMMMTGSFFIHLSLCLFSRPHTLTRLIHHAGTNGSQLWDAAFISQALVETGIGALSENQASATHLLDWLDKCQIRENPKWYVEGYRHATKGAWPFSTKEQGYTVSDCTAEGMKAVMMLQELP